MVSTVIITLTVNPNFTARITNTELLHVNKWLTANKITINADKTKYMIFSYNKNINLPLIQIGNHKIHEAETMKCLSIYFDNKLKFNKNINHRTSKQSKSIGILYKIHKFLPRNTLNLLYQSFVHPCLIYGIKAWYSVSETLNNKVFLMQKKVIRVKLDIVITQMKILNF